MYAKKRAGLEASSLKYDLITALGGFALAGPAGTQRLVLRLITLLTARYNWRLAELRAGQREIAALWSVDERTVKREMARLRGLGWLVLTSPARRGRVATYALDPARILADTRACWDRVGPDFVDRLAGLEKGAGTGLETGTVVPFPRPEPEHPPQPEAAGRDAWAAMRRLLRSEDEAIFANWFAALTSGGEAGGALILRAPSSFHASYIRTHFADRLLRALDRIEGPGGLRIVAAEDAAEAR